MISKVLPAVAAVTNRLPLGLRRSYGDLSNRILDTSSVYRNLRSTVAEMGSALLDFSRTPATPAEERLYEFARLIRPITSPSLSLLRVGGSTDGAYVMQAFAGVDAAISIGVGHDVSWDQELARHGIPVYLFDPTVAGLPGAVPGGQFYKIGLGDRTRVAGTDMAGMDLRSLGDILQLTGKATSNELILKIDVEGAEWDALHDVDFAQFQQVLIEMHDLSRLRDAEASVAVLKTVHSLAKTHAPVHVHGNNESPFCRFDRYWFPDVIELSFVRKAGIVDYTPAVSLRTEFDQPSNPLYPDYDMTGLLTIIP